MAVTYGFYNSINHDRRYDAVQVGQIFDGIIHDGVYETYKKALIVKASSVANQVIIQPGRAWFNHTWTYNDADLPFSAPGPEALYERIDALVLDINQNLNQRKNSFMWVKGTPAASPSKPTLTRSGAHWQYPLAYVHRYGNQNTIRADDIENAVGTSLCPFVLGVIEYLSIDELLAQWTAQFNTYITTKQNQWNTFQTNMEEIFFEWIENQKAAYDLFLSHNETAWRNWFDHVQIELDENVAAHLQNQIDRFAYIYISDKTLFLPNTGTSIVNNTLFMNI